MIWPIVIFVLIYLFLAVFMAMAGFHVYRFRFFNDISSPIFIFTVVIFLLVGALTFTTFRYASTESATSNVTAPTPL